MKRWLLFILICANLTAQTPVVMSDRISDFSVDADAFVGYDKFDFGYSIKNNVLSKFKGETLVQYKNVSLGTLTRVDLQNPLQLVLFYETFNTVVLLDNQLNEIRRINFSESDSQIVATAAGIASQNRLWIYNSATQRIGLWDLQSNEYHAISTPMVHADHDYYTDFNTFHWIDDARRHFSCNVYGKITDLGAVPDYDIIRIIDDRWTIYSKNAKISAYNTVTKQSFPIATAEKSFETFYATPQILVIFTAGTIANYKIKLP